MNAFAAFPAIDSHPSSGLVADASVGILWPVAGAAAAVDVGDAAAQGPLVAVYTRILRRKSKSSIHRVQRTLVSIPRFQCTSICLLCGCTAAVCTTYDTTQ